MIPSTALIIFVKTPGVSPVKTRLANRIGKDKAIEFYRLSLRATEARAKAIQAKVPSVSVYWAVAEKECLDLPEWKEFPVIYQGEGGLGDRLAEVYSKALNLHARVCFMGADSPQIPESKVIDCICTTQGAGANEFQLGRTIDGGFYFFGGRVFLPKQVWTHVTYSAETTCDELRVQLGEYGSVGYLPLDFDIDTFDDLIELSKVEAPGELLPQQTELIAWARKVFNDYGV